MEKRMRKNPGKLSVLTSPSALPLSLCPSPVPMSPSSLSPSSCPPHPAVLKRTSEWQVVLLPSFHFLSLLRALYFFLFLLSLCHARLLPPPLPTEGPEFTRERGGRLLVKQSPPRVKMPRCLLHQGSSGSWGHLQSHTRQFFMGWAPPHPQELKHKLLSSQCQPYFARSISKMWTFIFFCYWHWPSILSDAMLTLELCDLLYLLSYLFERVRNIKEPIAKYDPGNFLTLTFNKSDQRLD